MRPVTTLAALTASLLLACASPAFANGNHYTVTGTADGTGDCTGTPPLLTCPTLRAAVDDATKDVQEDAIQLDDATYTLDAPLAVSAGDLFIFGSGARDTRLQGSGGHRVLEVSSGAAVFLSGMTVSGGSAPAGDVGGNILNQGELSLQQTRVTGGSATGGGGVANIGTGADLVLALSLLDQNSHGGIYNRSGGELSAFSSTLAANHDYAISSADGGSDVSLYQVTIARNPDIGLALDNVGSWFVFGSIVSDNGGENCNLPVPNGDDVGYNVADDTSCGLTAASSHQNTNPQLAPTLENAGGQTDVFTIPATSPAVDIVPTCYFADQRGFPRAGSGGGPCDAGAYEQSAASAALISSGPSGTTTATTATFTFGSATATSYECALQGPGQTGQFSACTSPKTYSGLTPGAYRFGVRGLDAEGLPTDDGETRAFAVVNPAAAVSPTPTPTPTTPSPEPPTPVFHKDVVVKPVSGTVRVKLKGTNTFVDLASAQDIPLGSTIDVKAGRIQLSSVPRAGGTPQTATFYGGVFQISQPGAITDLKLNEPLATCPKRAKKAAVAARKKKPKTRSLWGQGSGSFRTSGRYSAATVRGTKWLVQDSCAGTLTRVTQGVVNVRDNVRRKTVVVRAGHRYLAKPQR